MINIDDFLRAVITDLEDRNLHQNDIKGVLFEKSIIESISNVKANSYSNAIIKTELISGQKFPDIVMLINNVKIGIEAKTNYKSWCNLGGSIFESTRVDGLDEIYIIMANYDNDTVYYRYDSYQNVIDNVLITHSPRYHINMDSNFNIFKDIGVNYNDVHKAKYPFDLFKDFLKKKYGKNADFWWMTKDDDINTPQSIVNINSLSVDEKEKIKIETLALFPSLIQVNNKNKYQEINSFLITKKGVQSSSLRDFYTAGGKVNIYGFFVPKIFELYTDKKILKQIELYFSDSSNEYLIHEYLHPISVKNYNSWISEIINHINSMGIGESQIIPSISFLMYIKDLLNSTRQE